MRIDFQQLPEAAISCRLRPQHPQHRAGRTPAVYDNAGTEGMMPQKPSGAPGTCRGRRLAASTAFSNNTNRLRL